MVQAAKFIDVTKSFIPIDPNAFPESLYGTESEDSPAKRIPEAAYIGYNILPTMYGYKSYFGTNRNVGIDALPARADFVFNYQNASLKNVLIALTERGIYTKPGDTSGAWTQNVVLSPAPNDGQHYDWSFTVIDDNLYAYRQGGASYYEIISNALPTGVTVNTKTPNFLNMTGQIGIFRAGGRLAFWDSEDSIGWSSLDDYTDFTPSIETLAGNSKFSDVVGRIIQCLPHGDGFIIYATKSIVYIQEQSESTYQWKPEGILSNVGITYPRNVCTAIPDTVHFAWTNSGLYRIERTKPEIIVPEVTDFLKEAKVPVYLSLLEGRHLVIELLDPNYVGGYTEFTEEVIPPIDYVFPGSKGELGDIPPETMTGIDICHTLDYINNGNYDDQAESVKSGMPGGVIPADKKAGTRMKPIWTCFLSRNGSYDPDGITFGAVPCATVDPNGVEKNLSPANYAPTLAKMGQTSANKTPMTGAEAYVDGIWTMERFIATQSAIWEMEDAALAASINKILNRNASVTKTSISGSNINTGPTEDRCAIGSYVSQYSGAQFGYSSCQFWLTRFAISALDIKRVKVNRVSSTPTTPPPVAPTFDIAYQIISITPPGPTVNAHATGASISAAYSAMFVAFGSPVGGTDYGTVTFSPPSGLPSVGGTVYFNVDQSSGPDFTSITTFNTTVGGGFAGKNFNTPANLAVSCPGGYTYDAGTQSCVWSGGPQYENYEQMNAYNLGIPQALPPPLAVDSPYCKITGFTYEANDGSTKTVAVADGSCTAPAITPGGVNGAPYKAPPQKGNVDDILSTVNGSVCSIPFEPVTVPGTPGIVTDWPDTVVTIPAGSFLLQNGSIAPVYPTFEGFLSYDLQLKKWGTAAGQYKLLVDYSPINNATNGVIPYQNFSIMAGVLKSDGKVYLFDNAPSSSRITYGKIGYYRLGMTSPEEVRVQFRTASSGEIMVETSLNGRHLSTGLTKNVSFTDTMQASIEGMWPGKWSNITISGIFDLSYLEYRGFKQGRR